MFVTRSGVGNELLTSLPTPEVSCELLTCVTIDDIGLSCGDAPVDYHVDYYRIHGTVFTLSIHRACASTCAQTALTNTA